MMDIILYIKNIWNIWYISPINLNTNFCNIFIIDNIDIFEKKINCNKNITEIVENVIKAKKINTQVIKNIHINKTLDIIEQSNYDKQFRSTIKLLDFLNKVAILTRNNIIIDYIVFMEKFIIFSEIIQVCINLIIQLLLITLYVFLYILKILVYWQEYIVYNILYYMQEKFWWIINYNLIFLQFKSNINYSLDFFYNYTIDLSIDSLFFEIEWLKLHFLNKNCNNLIFEHNGWVIDQNRLKNSYNGLKFRNFLKISPLNYNFLLYKSLNQFGWINYGISDLIICKELEYSFNSSTFGLNEINLKIAYPKWINNKYNSSYHIKEILHKLDFWKSSRVHFKNKILKGALSELDSSTIPNPEYKKKLKVHWLFREMWQIKRKTKFFEKSGLFGNYIMWWLYQQDYLLAWGHKERIFINHPFKEIVNKSIIHDDHFRGPEGRRFVYNKLFYEKKNTVWSIKEKNFDRRELFLAKSITVEYPHTWYKEYPEFFRRRGARYRIHNVGVSMYFFKIRSKNPFEIQHFWYHTKLVNKLFNMNLQKILTITKLRTNTALLWNTFEPNRALTYTQYREILFKSFKKIKDVRNMNLLLPQDVEKKKKIIIYNVKWYSLNVHMKLKAVFRPFMYCNNLYEFREYYKDYGDDIAFHPIIWSLSSKYKVRRGLRLLLNRLWEQLIVNNKHGVRLNSYYWFQFLDTGLKKAVGKITYKYTYEKEDDGVNARPIVYTDYFRHTFYYSKILSMIPQRWHNYGFTKHKFLGGRPFENIKLWEKDLHNSYTRNLLRIIYKMQHLESDYKIRANYLYYKNLGKNFWFSRDILFLKKQQPLSNIFFKQSFNLIELDKEYNLNIFHYSMHDDLKFDKKFRFYISKEKFKKKIDKYNILYNKFSTILKLNAIVLGNIFEKNSSKFIKYKLMYHGIVYKCLDSYFVFINNSKFIFLYYLESLKYYKHIKNIILLWFNNYWYEKDIFYSWIVTELYSLNIIIDFTWYNWTHTQYYLKKMMIIIFIKIPIYIYYLITTYYNYLLIFFIFSIIFILYCTIVWNLLAALRSYIPLNSIYGIRVSLKAKKSWYKLKLIRVIKSSIVDGADILDFGIEEDNSKNILFKKKKRFFTKKNIVLRKVLKNNTKILYKTFLFERSLKRLSKNQRIRFNLSMETVKFYQNYQELLWHKEKEFEDDIELSEDLNHWREQSQIEAIKIVEKKMRAKGLLSYKRKLENIDRVIKYKDKIIQKEFSTNSLKNWLYFWKKKKYKGSNFNLYKFIQLSYRDKLYNHGRESLWLDLNLDKHSKLNYYYIWNPKKEAKDLTSFDKFKIIVRYLYRFISGYIGSIKWDYFQHKWNLWAHTGNIYKINIKALKFWAKEDFNVKLIHAFETSEDSNIVGDFSEHNMLDLLENLLITYRDKSKGFNIRNDKKIVKLFLVLKKKKKKKILKVNLNDILKEEKMIHYRWKNLRYNLSLYKVRKKSQKIANLNSRKTRQTEYYDLLRKELERELRFKYKDEVHSLKMKYIERKCEKEKALMGNIKIAATTFEKIIFPGLQDFQKMKFNHRFRNIDEKKKDRILQANFERHVRNQHMLGSSEKYSEIKKIDKKDSFYYVQIPGYLKDLKIGKTAINIEEKRFKRFKTGVKEENPNNLYSILYKDILDSIISFRWFTTIGTRLSYFWSVFLTLIYIWNYNFFDNKKYKIEEYNIKNIIKSSWFSISSFLFKIYWEDIILTKNYNAFKKLGYQLKNILSFSFYLLPWILLSIWVIIYYIFRLFLRKNNIYISKKVFNILYYIKQKTKENKILNILFKIFNILNKIIFIFLLLFWDFNKEQNIFNKIKINIYNILGKIQVFLFFVKGFYDLGKKQSGKKQGILNIIKWIYLRIRYYFYYIKEYLYNNSRNFISINYWKNIFKFNILYSSLLLKVNLSWFLLRTEFPKNLVNIYWIKQRFLLKILRWIYLNLHQDIIFYSWIEIFKFSIEYLIVILNNIKEFIYIFKKLTFLKKIKIIVLLILKVITFPVYIIIKYFNYLLDYKYFKGYTLSKIIGLGRIVHNYCINNTISHNIYLFMTATNTLDSFILYRSNLYTDVYSLSQFRKWFREFYFESRDAILMGLYIYFFELEEFYKICEKDFVTSSWPLWKRILYYYVLSDIKALNNWSEISKRQDISRDLFFFYKKKDYIKLYIKYFYYSIMNLINFYKNNDNDIIKDISELKHTRLLSKDNKLKIKYGPMSDSVFMGEYFYEIPPELWLLVLLQHYYSWYVVFFILSINEYQYDEEYLRSSRNYKWRLSLDSNWRGWEGFAVQYSIDLRHDIEDYGANMLLEPFDPMARYYFFMIERYLMEEVYNEENKAWVDVSWVFLKTYMKDENTYELDFEEKVLEEFWDQPNKVSIEKVVEDMWEWGWRNRASWHLWPTVERISEWKKSENPHILHYEGDVLKNQQIRLRRHDEKMLLNKFIPSEIILELKKRGDFIRRTSKYFDALFNFSQKTKLQKETYWELLVREEFELYDLEHLIEDNKPLDFPYREDIFFKVNRLQYEILNKKFGIVSSETGVVEDIFTKQNIFFYVYDLIEFISYERTHLDLSEYLKRYLILKKNEKSGINLIMVDLNSDYLFCERELCPYLEASFTLNIWKNRDIKAFEEKLNDELDFYGISRNLRPVLYEPIFNELHDNFYNRHHVSYKESLTNIYKMDEIYEPDPSEWAYDIMDKWACEQIIYGQLGVMYPNILGKRLSDLFICNLKCSLEQWLFLKDIVTEDFDLFNMRVHFFNERHRLWNLKYVPVRVLLPIKLDFPNESAWHQAQALRIHWDRMFTIGWGEENFLDGFQLPLLGAARWFHLRLILQKHFKEDLFFLLLELWQPDNVITNLTEESKFMIRQKFKEIGVGAKLVRYLKMFNQISILHYNNYFKDLIVYDKEWWWGTEEGDFNYTQYMLMKLKEVIRGTDKVRKEIDRTAKEVSCSYSPESYYNFYYENPLSNKVNIYKVILLRIGFFMWFIHEWFYNESLLRHWTYVIYPFMIYFGLWITHRAFIKHKEILDFPSLYLYRFQGKIMRPSFEFIRSKEWLNILENSQNNLKSVFWLKPSRLQRRNSYWSVIFIVFVMKFTSFIIISEGEYNMSWEWLHAYPPLFYDYVEDSLVMFFEKKPGTLKTSNDLNLSLWDYDGWMRLEAGGSMFSYWYTNLFRRWQKRNFEFLDEGYDFLKSSSNRIGKTMRRWKYIQNRKRYLYRKKLWKNQIKEETDVVEADSYFEHLPAHSFVLDWSDRYKWHRKIYCIGSMPDRVFLRKTEYAELILRNIQTNSGLAERVVPRRAIVNINYRNWLELRKTQMMWSHYDNIWKIKQLYKPLYRPGKDADWRTSVQFWKRYTREYGVTKVHDWKIMNHHRSFDYDIIPQPNWYHDGLFAVTGKQMHQLHFNSYIKSMSYFKKQKNKYNNFLLMPDLWQHWWYYKGRGRYHLKQNSKSKWAKLFEESEERYEPRLKNFRNAEYNPYYFKYKNKRLGKDNGFIFTKDLYFERKRRVLSDVRAEAKFSQPYYLRKRPMPWDAFEVEFDSFQEIIDFFYGFKIGNRFFRQQESLLKNNKKFFERMISFKKKNALYENGNIIDEYGNIIDENEEIIDESGNIIDEYGDIIEKSELHSRLFYNNSEKRLKDKFFLKKNSSWDIIKNKEDLYYARTKWRFYEKNFWNKDSSYATKRKWTYGLDLRGFLGNTWKRAYIKYYRIPKVQPRIGKISKINNLYESNFIDEFKDENPYSSLRSFNVWRYKDHIGCFFPKEQLSKKLIFEIKEKIEFERRQEEIIENKSQEQIIYEMEYLNKYDVPSEKSLRQGLIEEVCKDALYYPNRYYNRFLLDSRAGVNETIVVVRNQYYNILMQSNNILEEDSYYNERVFNYLKEKEVPAKYIYMMPRIEFFLNRFWYNIYNCRIVGYKNRIIYLEYILDILKNSKKEEILKNEIVAVKQLKGYINDKIIETIEVRTGLIQDHFLLKRYIKSITRVFSLDEKIKIKSERIIYHVKEGSIISDEISNIFWETNTLYETINIIIEVIKYFIK